MDMGAMWSPANNAHRSEDGIAVWCYTTRHWSFERCQDFMKVKSFQWISKSKTVRNSTTNWLFIVLSGIIQQLLQ